MKHPQPRTAREPRLLRLEEAARILGIGLRTLQTLIAAGHFQVIRVSSRRVGVDPADIEAYIARCRR